MTEVFLKSIISLACKNWNIKYKYIIKPKLSQFNSNLVRFQECHGHLQCYPIRGWEITVEKDWNHNQVWVRYITFANFTKAYNHVKMLHWKKRMYDVGSFSFVSSLINPPQEARIGNWLITLLNCLSSLLLNLPSFQYAYFLTRNHTCHASFTHCSSFSNWNNSARSIVQSHLLYPEIIFWIELFS